MVRSAWVSLACLSGAHARCSCDATPALSDMRPVKIPEVNLTASPSPITAIGAVAKQNSDWSKTMQQMMDASAKMAGQLVAGQAPSETDILNSVGALVVEAVGMENPILGGIASFIYSFFQGLFGSSTNQYRALYDMIMHQVEHMIAESEIKTKMELVKDSIEGYIQDSSYLSRTGQQAKADYFYQNRPLVMDSQCWAKDWAATSCKQWEQHGAVVHGVLFASLHLQTLNEIAASHHGDQAKVKTYLQEIVDNGEQYIAVLKHSLASWYEHRMSQQNMNYYNAAVGGNCFHGHQGDCYAKSADHFGARVDGCPACDFCIVDNHEEPYKSRAIAWHNAWQSCHTSHRSKLQAHMNQLSSNIDGIAKLVAAAKKVSAPSPAPKPSFADHIPLGHSLQVDQMIVSSDGWNRLVMQSDGNVVVYADNYDGVNSDGAKSVWAKGSAGSNARLNFQGDGNLVLYASSGSVKWASGTNGKGGARLTMQTDGNLCMYTSSNQAVWCSNSRVYGAGAVNASAVLV